MKPTTSERGETRTSIDEQPRPARFAGRVAFVTGGASGIGAAIVRRFIVEGGRVAVADIDHDRLSAIADEFGDAAMPVYADVTKEDELEAAVGATVARLGGLDVGFNVAGCSHRSLIFEEGEQSWRRTQDVSLNGVFLAMKHESRQMIDLGIRGSIVNVASMASQVPIRGGAAYCAAKAGVVMLGQCAALDLDEHGIRVNTVSPGITATPMAAPVLADRNIARAFLERLAIPRFGEPEDSAAAALFLASDDASYITGTNLFVDGGWRLAAYPENRAARMPELRAESAEADRH